jgi:hypothetical protein
MESMSLGFYSKSEAYLVSLCPDGIGRTWDPSGIDVTFRGIPSGIDVTFRGISSEIGWTWNRTDLGLDGHGIPSGIDVTFRGIPPGNNPYPLISEG